ncbi:DNA-binding transcriptional regulator, AcrR family [Mycolicibacterium rutilum]|uniref:DNA-binding transcriptional regulator, AcrR family n=1 Tax=Mycolicibacterium rutilum TaxID=370526 RepID=A0A1H6JN57_MYCRU|nr:TetR family transcriptional regulator [Mycolicibacterium rutilum]SEH63825.1 DNA-binding transcriptional regulator, AcrR family [Mycolicibacterium rutilum]
MVRWQPNARGRLEEAALELYAENGFDRTTVAEIAERAGLTERTFFRHFADKREVLFSGQDALVDILSKTVVEAPDSLSPLAAVGAGLIAVGAQFDDRHELARRRQQIIDATPALQERELSKLAALADALAAALRARGVPDTAARLGAESGVSVFKVAFEQWLPDDGADLVKIIETVLADLRAVAGGG